MDSNKNLVQLVKSLLSPSRANTFHPKYDKRDSGDKKQHSFPSSFTSKNHQVTKDKVISFADEVDTKSLEQPSIQSLPLDCKLEILLYLTATEKVQCQRVCKEWRELIKHRCLWKKIDFSEVIRSFEDSKSNGKTLDETCIERQRGEEKRIDLETYYEGEKIRMMGYFKYLSQLRPKPTELHVCLDIGDLRDHWLGTLKAFLDNTDLSGLKRASINWKETPWKLFRDSSYTWSNSNYSDLIYKHRRRQRQFVTFLDTFTAQATGLEYLNLPFDWSLASVTHICRLRGSLKELVLTEYFVPQSFHQSLLDKILSSLTKLERLTLNVVFGSGLGLMGYQFNSPSLKYLNLSKCKGIAISNVNMPRVEVLLALNDTFLSHYLAGSDDNIIGKKQTSILQCQSSPPSSSSTFSASSLPSSLHYHHRIMLESSLSLPESSFLSLLAVNLYQMPNMPKPLTLNKKMSTKKEEKLAFSSFSEMVFNTSSLPCLMSVLKNGAPSLKQLNHFHFTDASWPTFIDSSLNKALLETCFCKSHSSRTFSKHIFS